MILCIYIMYLSVLIFIYIVSQEFLCVYILILYTARKFYVVYSSWILGMLQYGIRAPIFNIEPGWVEQVELK
jgi:hypothetical protein